MSRRNAKPRNEHEAQDQANALEVLALMRREGLSRRAAAKAVGITTKELDRYVGSAIRQDKPGGRFRASAYDRIPRDVNFLTAEGEIPLTVRDSRTASLISQYKNAFKAYAGGDTSALNPFKGKSFRANGVNYRFVTNPDVLDQLIDAGIPTEGLYRAVYGAGL